MNQVHMVLAEGLAKTYVKAGQEIRALDGVQLKVAPGEFVAINGPSGSGKTTLLFALSGLVRPTGGRVCVDGQDLGRLSPGGAARFRAERIGLVFQTFYLVPYLTALENVRLAQSAAGVNDSGRAALELLEQVGLARRAGHYPSELSAGEQQRVALARAMINHPRLLLGDEPTGNLDSARGQEVLELISQYHHRGATVILVTHSEQVSRFATRRLTLVDGKLSDSR